MNITPLRLGIIVAVIVCWIFSGCTSPLVEINRTGSALPDVNILNGNQANGNTVPLVGQ